MQVEAIKQVPLDTRSDPIPRESPVRHDHAGSAPAHTPLARASQLPHDELQKQQRSLRCLPVARKIALDTFLFLAAKWRICNDDVDSFVISDLTHAKTQGV